MDRIVSVGVDMGDFRGEVIAQDIFCRGRAGVGDEDGVVAPFVLRRFELDECWVLGDNGGE